MTIRTRGAALMAALAFASAIVMGSAPKTLADPIQPPPPKPIPYPVAQPDDLPRISPIGGAQVKTNTPLGLGSGTGRPLAAGRERSNVTISPSPTDGTHLPTAIAGKDVVLHLPQERELTPAQWGDGGAATFTSRDTDYRISPFAGGGADVNIIRRTIFTPENFTFGLRVPEGTHVRQGSNVVLVESDAAPGLPATTIATLSVPVARDAKGNPVQVNPVIHGDYMYQQSNLALDLGPADIFAFPITITLSYRASSIPASGQLATDWEGLPEGGGPPEAKKAVRQAITWLILAVPTGPPVLIRSYMPSGMPIAACPGPTSSDPRTDAPRTSGLRASGRPCAWMSRRPRCR